MQTDDHDMSNEQTLSILNRLHAIERFSLANYARYAHPWTPENKQHVHEAILDIADEQQRYANSIGSLIVDRNGYVEGGSFPVRYAALNDVSLDCFARRVIEDQKRIIQAVETWVGELTGDTAARELAQEVLGAEKGHLDNLLEAMDEVTNKPVRSTAEHDSVVAASTIAAISLALAV